MALKNNKSEIILVEEISRKVKNEMNPVFRDLISNHSEIVNSEGLLELVDWYKKTRKSKGNRISYVVNAVINTLMKNLPQHFANTVISNIQISSQGKQNGVKFTASHTDEIKPYVEFVVKVNGQQVKADRMTFTISSTLEFEELEIRASDNNKNEICLGNLAIDLEIFLTRLPFISFPKPLKLGEREIDIDLSKLSLTV